MAGRWHSKGRPIVYTAESSALAVLEVLVHLEVDRVPPDFQLLRVDAPDGLAATEYEAARPATLTQTRKWGDQWLAAGRTALAEVPSAIAPGGSNWLVNPAHQDAKAMRVTAKSRWPWDQRLFR